MEWKQHPVLTDYWSSGTTGQIKGPTGVVSRGSLKDDGYMYRAQYSAHRLIWEAFNGLIPAGMQIDHINGDKRDDSLANLQLVSPSQHAVKTRLDNPGMVIATVQHKMMKVMRIGKDGTKMFASQCEAARETPGAWQQHISKCIAGEISVHAGYVWRRVANEDTDDGNDWVSLRDAHLKGLQVSRQGLVRKRNSVPFSGALIGAYYVVRFRNKAHRVHRLVCLAFHGYPGCSELTVDHIDRNPLNNHADNLRWATAIQQAANKRRRV